MYLIAYNYFSGNPSYFEQKLYLRSIKMFVYRFYLKKINYFCRPRTNQNFNIPNYIKLSLHKTILM